MKQVMEEGAALLGLGHVVPSVQQLFTAPTVALGRIKVLTCTFLDAEMWCCKALARVEERGNSYTYMYSIVQSSMKHLLHTISSNFS